MFVQAVAGGPHKPAAVMSGQVARQTGAQTAHAAQAGVAAAQTAQVETAVKIANQHMKMSARGVEFSIDEDSGRTIVRLLDSDTKQVLRQFPSEEMLSISRSLEHLEGLLLSQSA